MKRKIETYITPQTDREWPADHPLRSTAKVVGAHPTRRPTTPPQP